MTDILIIGAGPAGLTAAIYALRAGKTVRILEKGAMGGQMTHSPKIENYPGFAALSGNELADRMVEQALGLGAEIELCEVGTLAVENGAPVAHTDCGDFTARAAIVAVGAAHRQLGLPGENELSGVSYCAVCDGAFYQDQDVLLIGGGNSSMQEALLLCETCRSVTMVQNLAMLTGEAALAARIAEKPNIRVIYNSVVVALHGETAFTGATVKNTETGEETLLPAEGMFVAIGLNPDTAAVKDLLELENGYVKADESCRTPLPCVFVAGDCRTKGVRQITTAAADGAAAALAAVRYLG